MPTDTLYGICASAFSREAVERVYRLRKRDLKKPMIVLIGPLADLKKFGIRLKPKTYNLLTNLWPGKISIVLPLSDKRQGTRDKFYYLHRGTKTLAFRLPKSAKLRVFLKKTGPLVAPSANLEGLPPAKTITQAKKYFGGKVDFYINAGRLDSPPSTVVSVAGGKVRVLRQGAARISK